ncbi:MAG: SH3 domain-containing protein [Anaerolineae bacterium]
MKQHRWMIAISLIALVILSGCGPGPNGEPAEEEVLKPINAADWPTPVPPTPSAAATPFPKVTLAPTATPTAQPDPAPAAPDAGALGIDLGGDADALAEEVTRLSGGLPPVAVALVQVDGVALRQGPGQTYPAVSQVPRDEPAGVLGRDASGNWLYVLTLSLEQGWLPAESLRIIGSLAEAPVLPPDPLAALLGSEAGSEATSPTGPPAASPQPLDLDALAPVATARVASQGLNLRQGPGTAYAVLEALAQGDEVAVLAINQAQDWVLVRTAADGQAGWVSLAFLNVTGALDEAPNVVTSSPDRDLPPGQVAPVFDPAALAAAGSAPGSAANPPGVGSASRLGRLVIQSASGEDIYVINADGSGLRRLTHGIDPALSPDGQTVAFTRWTGDDSALWLIGVDGGGERAVLGEMRKAKGPEWSPDGTRIALNFQHGGRLEKRKVCKNLMELGDKDPGIPFNVDPDDIGVETRDGVPHLCWKLPPDPHWSLRVVNLADGSFEDLYGGLYAFRPAWDPSRTWRIITDAGNGLLESDVNRDYWQNITDHIGDGSPVFSPDGRYLAVAVNQNGQFDIHRLNNDGSGRVRLTQTPFFALVGPNKQDPWQNVSPAWSPDGTEIAFLTNRTGRWEIWVMNADGSNQRPMFSEAVNDRLDIKYRFVDERVISWR